VEEKRIVVQQRTQAFQTSEVSRCMDVDHRPSGFQEVD
jgi:hypothetical protein